MCSIVISTETKIAVSLQFLSNVCVLHFPCPYSRRSSSAFWKQHSNVNALQVLLYFGGSLLMPMLSTIFCILEAAFQSQCSYCGSRIESEARNGGRKCPDTGDGLGGVTKGNRLPHHAPTRICAGQSCHTFSR